MKKKFLAVFCYMLVWHATLGYADVRSIIGLEDYQSPTRNMDPANAVTPDLPDPNNQEEVRAYFKKRFETAAFSETSAEIDLNKTTSINVIHTPEYYKAMEEKNKPLFQKMYEEALKSVHDEENSLSDMGISDVDDADERKAAASATRFFTLVKEDKAAEVEPQIPTVGFTLPSGRRVLAPAMEHIPYFLSYIDIQANGYLKIEDTIVVVANGKKFAGALQRRFPKYVYDQKNHASRLDLILQDVRINGTPIAYMAEEIGDDIVLKPKYKQELEPGVYTYTFDYMVNHHLQHYKDMIYMDWNLTGRPLNAFITSANAIVTLPMGHGFKEARTVISYKGQYTDRRTNIYRLAQNVIAFSNWTPLLNGESMNLVTVMDKKTFLPDFEKGISNFLSNWGSVLYACLGLMAVVLAYVLSLWALKYDHKKHQYNPTYNGSLMRHILVGKYDRIAFVAQLLDLYRKQAIDIKREDSRIFLTKNNIYSARLNKVEKRALKKLFAKKSSQVEINNVNNTIIKKCCKIFEKANRKLIKKHRLMHNISYVVFSCAMLLLTEIFVALNSINWAQSLTIMLAVSLLYAFYIWILRHRFKFWLVNVPIKIFALAAIFAIWVFSSVYIGGIVNAIILAIVAVIFAFTHIFSQQDSFVTRAKNSILQYKEYLQTNANAINLSRDFLNQQSNIYALSIADYFPQNVANKGYYKLPEADLIRQLLIGIVA